MYRLSCSLFFLSSAVIIATGSLTVQSKMAESGNDTAVDLTDPTRAVGLGMSVVIKSIKLKFSGVKNINTSTLADWLKPSSNTDVILLDSRPEEEYNISHIAGSKRVDWTTENMEELVKSLPVLTSDDPGKQKAVVCYCSVGYRSSAIAQKLQKYIDSQDSLKKVPVYNVEGALFKWANEHRPMIDAANQTTVVAHPFNAVWGKLLDKDLRKSPS